MYHGALYVVASTRLGPSILLVPAARLTCQQVHQVQRSSLKRSLQRSQLPRRRLPSPRYVAFVYLNLSFLILNIYSCRRRKSLPLPRLLLQRRASVHPRKPPRLLLRRRPAPPRRLLHPRRRQTPLASARHQQRYVHAPCFRELSAYRNLGARCRRGREGPREDQIRTRHQNQSQRSGQAQKGRT